jgi:hypothetical protein
MKQPLFVNTGIRLSGQQFAKLDNLAQSLNTSRNRAIGWLLDNAVVQAPTARVELQKNSRNSGHNTVTAESVRNS